MKILKMAGRSYLGYRLKAASILVFTSLAFTLILGGMNILYNSFSVWFARSSDLAIPRFFVSAKPGFDLDAQFGIRDIALKEADRTAVKAKLSGDFLVDDIVILQAQLTDRSEKQNSTYVLVVGVDFGRLEAVFPYFKGRLTPEKIDEYKKAPLALLNARTEKRIKCPYGSEVVLASQDYFRDFNAMKLTVRDLMPDGLSDGDFLGSPIAFIDLAQLKRLLALPEGYGPALALTPKRHTPTLSLADWGLRARIGSAIRPAGLGLREVSDISSGMASTFDLYRNVIAAFIAVLSLVVCLSVSSNLFMSFQSRRADFGLYKAFGCGNGRVFLMVLAENAFGIAFPLALAFLANALAAAFVPPFSIMNGFFVLTPGFSDIGVAAMAAIAIVICLASVLRSYRYLAGLEPVSIMREE